jgi:polyhydroxyalkanoate synthesis regulator phasin
MLPARKFATLLAAVALCLPIAACGEDDVDQARKDVQEQANKLKGNIDDLSKDDLQNALDDAESAAKNGSEDTKREARKLQRKIERELNTRN